MSRFPAPLDDFETDDFDIPTFEAPPRRHSRPNTSRPAPRRLSRPPIRPVSDFDDFEPAPPRAARPATRTKAPVRSHRPSTGKNVPSRAPKNAPRPAPPRALRGIHFQIAGVLLMAFGGLLAWNALQSAPDGALPFYALRGLRWAFGIGAIALPLGLVLLGVVLFLKRQNVNLRALGRGALCAFLTLLTAAHLLVPRGAEFLSRATLEGHGGYVGGALAWALRRALGEVGAVVALGAFALVALLLGTERTAGELGRKLRDKGSDFVHFLREKWQTRGEKREEKKARAQDPWDSDEDWDDAEEANPEEAERVLPPEIGREVRRSRRDSPFMALESVIGKESENEEKTTREAFPDAPAPAIDPNSSLDDPQFLEPPRDEAPRIEILDTPPPPSVVDSPVDIRAAIAGQNADEMLLPSEALERQAE
ncbi:MAG: DNA translocase FtsK 4TM domain-containing protein, partial [Armatimonadetes bacterium]|nr:DNA translocase FtsK 4TM domain-containing protein [Armatimonadota bacterium]